MARFLLAWELGANLGHVTRLRPVAQALKVRGHEVVFVLRDLAGSRALLGPELGRAFQAPLLLNAAPRPAWSLADVMLLCGFESARSLQPLVDGWVNLMVLTGCDAVVADHSPTALLAARCLGIPVLHIGHGFSIPPAHSPLPLFRDWEKLPTADHLARSDAQALASANAVLATAGVAPLQDLHRLFYPERTLLCAWPELDHYAGVGVGRAPNAYVGPDCEIVPGVPPTWPAGGGPRAFAYLRAAHPEHGAVLTALDQLGFSTECFMPDALTSAALPATPRIHYSSRPVDMRAVLAECSLVVCHAGHATVAQAMHAGVPCLMLPMQTEQFLLARQAERFGVGINAASLARPVNYRALVDALTVPNGEHALAARDLAEKYAAFDPAGLTAQIVAAAESLVH